jgi:hypothetical protein
MTKIHDDANAIERPKLLRGRRRMEQIAAETKLAVETNSRIMLAGLRQFTGREPTAIDRMDAEALASLAYQASKLREKGQSELEVWTTYARVRDGSAWATWPINPTYQKPALKRD